jgi:putative oxygen-independent coproporphyrinogen III oxidase
MTDTSRTRQIPETEALGDGTGWAGEIAKIVPRTDTPRGIYVHVPYCRSRCGYCDFNTYVPGELQIATSEYARLACREIELAAEVWDARSIDTVFLGGGTPTLLSSTEIAAILDEIDSHFGLTGDAEITIEANPDSVTRADLAALREAGVTRMSFGVQSLAPQVLATLERTHTPGNAVTAVADARAAGFDHVSADLIYATPGETDADVANSLREMLTAGVDHISAYSLIVEPGTRLAARVRRGEIPSPDDDVAAGRYRLIDEIAAAAGLTWYEVSNWARPGGECRHNLGYWRGHDWWPIGPGAHGFVGDHRGGVRWWNLKHPHAHAEAVRQGGLPIADGERIDAQTQRTEMVMLGLRLREGLASSWLADSTRERVQDFADSGLLEIDSDRIRVTDAGRLMVDGIVRALV